MVEPGLTCSRRLIASRFFRLSWLATSRFAEFGENRNRMSLLRSGSPSTGAAAARANGRDGHVLILVSARLFERLEMCEIDKPIAVHRILDQLGAVGVNRRLINAAKTSRGVDRAREEREILRQVGEMHLGQLSLRLLDGPI